MILKERIVYLCGPEKFMQSVENALSQLDYPMNNLMSEKFNF